MAIVDCASDSISNIGGMKPGDMESGVEKLSARSSSTTAPGNEACDSDTQDEKCCSNLQAEESSLERTASQEQKRKQVDDAAARIQDIEPSVSDLRDQIGKLREQLSSHSDAQAATDTLQKRARNLGEDLLQETLRLDSLVGLLQEDRAARKKALGLAEALLDIVDAAKIDASEIRQVLANEMAATETEKSGSSAADLAPSHAPLPDSDDAQKTVVASSSTPRQDTHTTCTTRDSMHTSAVNDHIVSPPKRELWEQTHLPMQFHMQEHRDYYVLVADACNLVSESLRLRIKECGLRVSGLCLPSVEESKRLQQYVNRHLQQIARQAPHKLDEVGGFAAATDILYAQVGQGSFGSFTETVRLPSDADHNGIRASCKDSKLQVLIPKLNFYDQPGWRSARLHGANPTLNRPYARHRHIDDLFGW